MKTPVRGPSERTICQDPRTGPTLWRLTQSDQEDKHRYSDARPWNADQSCVAFSSARPSDPTTRVNDLWVTDPTGTKIVTWDDEGVILVRVPEQTAECLTRFQRPFEVSHLGTHPHAAWNQDGTQILYNSAESGRSQLSLIPLTQS